MKLLKPLTTEGHFSFSNWLQLSVLNTLSADVSGIERNDFDASVETNVTHLVTGWAPLMDSSLKASAVINASVNTSYEQYEVSYYWKSVWLCTVKEIIVVADELCIALGERCIKFLGYSHGHMIS